VQPRLAAVAGVQRIEIFGARTFAMRIWLKPERMAALGISPSQLRDALAGAVTISGVVALTLSPTMSAKLLRSAQDEERGLSGWLNQCFDALREAYGRALGADLAVATGGDFVNRFNMDGRSYKVIPLVKRIDRLTSEQLGNIHVAAPNGEMVPLSAVAHIEHSVVARSLNRFQQLNAVKLSGMSARTLDEALSFLEDTAREILPPGYSYDYTGESRQLRTEGNKFLPAFSLAVLMIYLVLSVQFNSFRDPIVILAGSVPLAMFGALIFTVLKMPDPNLPHWTSGWTTTMNIYAEVGLVTLVGLIAKNGILIVEFAGKLQQQDLSKLDAVHQAAVQANCAPDRSGGQGMAAT